MAQDWSPVGQPGQIAGWGTFLKCGGQVPPERERKSLKGLKAAAPSLQPGEGILGGRGRRRAQVETRVSTEVRAPSNPVGSRWEDPDFRPSTARVSGTVLSRFAQPICQSPASDK